MTQNKVQDLGDRIFCERGVPSVWLMDTQSYRAGLVFVCRRGGAVQPVGEEEKRTMLYAVRRDAQRAMGEEILRCEMDNFICVWA